MPFLDNCFSLFIGEEYLGAQAAVLVEAYTPIRVILDPVRSVRHLFAHRFTRAVDAVDILHARGHFQLPGITKRLVHAGRVMARVATCILGPGTSPFAMAFLTSTSAYIAPSVSRSRIAVNPWESAIWALRAARIARYGIDSFSN